MSIDTQHPATSDNGGFRKPPSTIFDVIGVLTRRWWLIALLTFVGLLVAFVYTARQDKVYEATATTLVQRQSLAKSLNNIVDPGAQVNEGPRVLEAQAKLATSPEVAEATLKAVPGTGLDVNELLASVTVTPDVNGDLLDFALTNGDGNTAVKLINEYVDQYVIYSTQIAKQSAVEAAATVRRQLRQLERNGQRDTQGYQQLQRNRDSLRSLIALSTPTAQVVAKATGFEKTKPKMLIALVLGLALGLAIGLGVAFLLDALDGRVRSPDAIAAYLGVPLLAVMPAGRRGSGSGSGRNDPDSDEACRVLLAAIEGLENGRTGGSLLVTGIANPNTYSSIAANLAHTAARTGRDTALLDVGFRNASLTRLMGVKGHVGTSDVLLGDAPLSEASVALTAGEGTGLEGRLRLIPIGSQSGDSADLIGSKAVKELIERLATGETLVIVDAGATLDTSEAISAAGFVDKVLFVAATDEARHDSLSEARRRLEMTAAQTIGVAVIDVSA